MLNNISVGKFYNISSAIHNMNPTSKIICTFVFIISVLLASNLEILLVLATLLFVIILLSQLPTRLFFNQIYALRYIVVIIIAIYYLKQYEVLALEILLSKIGLIVLYASVLTLTTKATEITSGLAEFFAPLEVVKVPVAKLAVTVSLTLRFIPIMAEQLHRIIVALAARGLDYYAGYNNRLWTLKTALKPMFRLSVRRVKQIRKAMDVRLYNYHKKRTNYNAKDWGILDGLMVVTHIAIFGYMTLNRMGLI